MSTNNVAPWIASYDFEITVNHGERGGGMKVHRVHVAVDMQRIALKSGVKAAINTTKKATGLHRAVQVIADAGTPFVLPNATTT